VQEEGAAVNSWALRLYKSIFPLVDDYDDAVFSGGGADIEWCLLSVDDEFDLVAGVL
jgi:hypothetical protein